MIHAANVADTVRERDGWRCQLCGRRACEPAQLPVVTIAGGPIPTAVPVDENATANNDNELDNAVAVCQSCLVEKLQRGWRIVRFSYAAKDMEVIDATSRRVPHEEVWFHNYVQLRDVEHTVAVFAELVQHLRTLADALGAGLAELRESPELRAALGYRSLAEAAVALGIDPSWARWLANRALEDTGEKGARPGPMLTESSAQDVLRGLVESYLATWVAAAVLMDPLRRERRAMRALGYPELRTLVRQLGLSCREIRALAESGRAYRALAQIGLAPETVIEMSPWDAVRLYRGTRKVAADTEDEEEDV